MELPNALIEQARTMLTRGDFALERQLLPKLARHLDVSPKILSLILLRLCLTYHSPARSASPPPKMRRYRLEVGQAHGADRQRIEDLLVAEAGVERRLLTHIDIRDAYTLVDLPEGMPGDIFTHLRTVTLDGRPLAIHRARTGLNNRRQHPRMKKKCAHRP